MFIILIRVIISNGDKLLKVSFKGTKDIISNYIKKVIRLIKRL